MEWMITIVGLLIAAAGVYLSWYKKGNETWATYLFGFSLVLVGGPLGSQITSFSINEEGIKLSLNKSALEPDEIAIIKGVAAQSIGIELELSSADVSSKSYDSDIQSVQKNFIDYFQSIGYIPTQLVGSGGLSPGSIITYIEGRPWLLASPGEAFPELNIQTSPVSLPQFSVKTAGPGIGSTTEKIQTKTNFFCASATSNKASMAALQKSASGRVISKISGSNRMLVVQDVIVCSKLALESARDIAGRQDKAEVFFYESDTPVVLGYRVVSLALEN